MAYDAENRLVEVKKNSVVIAQFVYDGDGKRVKATENNMTTIFVGNHYEVNTTTGEVTKYYFAGTQRIATLAPHCVRCSAGVRKQTVPQNPQVTYLLGDHLGSTSIVTDEAGTLLVETRYKPWGEVRYSTPDVTLPTRYSYTGQYSHMSDEATDLGNVGFGLMFYNARWYDPSLSRFTQADTIIPDGVQGLDRYAYVNNSPVNFNDPTGHMAIGDTNEGGCNTPGSPRCILNKYYGVSTDIAWMQDFELYYYQKAYSQYNAGTDPYLEPTQIAEVMAPMNREGCVAGSFWSCFAMSVQGGIGTFAALPKITPPMESAPQNYGHDPADPDCAGCGYSWDLSASIVPGGEPQITILGFSEDVSAYTNVNVNILNNQPFYSWEGMNVQFLKSAIYRRDTIVYVSDYTMGLGRTFPKEVFFLENHVYTNIIDMFHPVLH